MNWNENTEIGWCLTDGSAYVDKLIVDGKVISDIKKWQKIPVKQEVKEGSHIKVYWIAVNDDDEEEEFSDSTE